ncbi:GIY-YIG nuclease family protein [Marinicella meishanensis]|uniref:GIY-YIG nuclease family protein n=1 Tax=Marinicella meishanensis TaxID=2873263 RepID=UPI001CC17EC3|nr:GIY-YIG nuclease family protein [Marinicella sp. NBU2979]
MTATKTYHLYLLLCDDSVLYTGIALDPIARLAQHRQGKGAKAIRRFQQLKLVYQVEVGDKGLAQQLEYRIKQWPKSQKQALVDQPLALNALLEATELAE